MKLKIEPNKLSGMLTTGLIGSQLSNITALISPNGLSFQDVSLGTHGVYAVYLKDFFTEFNNQNERVTFTKYLLDVISKGFKNDEQVNLFTEGNKLFLTGARDKFEDLIPEVETSKFPVVMTQSQYGIIPQKIDTDKSIVAKFAASELNLMDAETYHFDSDGKKLDVRIEFTDTSAYTKTLKPLAIANMPVMSAAFSGELYKAILKPLSGEVWMLINEDSMAITKKEKAFSITLMLAGRV